MTDNTEQADPIEAALGALRAQREKIDQAISVLESLRGTDATGARPQTTPEEVGPGTFHGMSIPEAAKKLLEIRKRSLGNQEIATALKGGGLVLRSENPANTIGSILTRRFRQVGDIVRVGRGTWGLKEWHPTIRYSPKNGKKEEEEQITEIRRPRSRFRPTEKEGDSS